MSMIKAMRMLNAIENGTTSGAELETLLADDGRYAELSVLVDMPGQARRIASAPTTITAISESARASQILADSPVSLGALVGEDTNFKTMLHSENWYNNTEVVERLMREVTTRAKIFSMKDLVGALNSAATSYISVVALSDTLALTCYSGASSYGYAQVIKLVDETVTLGDPTAFSGGVGANDISVSALSATSAIVVYKNVSTGYGNGVVLTIDDTTVTFGSATTFNSRTSSNLTVASVSVTKAVVAWSEATGTNYALVINISGSTITYGSTVSTTSIISIQTSLAVVSDTTVLWLFKNNSGYAAVVVLTLLGSMTISLGTARVLNAAEVVTLSIAKISSSRAIAFFATGGREGYASIITTDGTSVSFTTPVAFATEKVYYITASLVSPGTVLACYQDNTSYYGKLRIIKVVDNTLTVDDAITINGMVTVTSLWHAVLSGYRVVVCYRNGSTTYGNYSLVGV